MIKFLGGFISGQTGDMCKKPETAIEKVQKVEKVKKWGFQKMESGKYRFAMWLINEGPYSFWFRANSRLNCVGCRFRCEL